ncbi:DEKNAAC101495 [Brettanomyces naardenensis]|uniref:DEKNAAC101495 n=1 Tax=Brettanomyces naardenensis TaxID=13370 RepID=A0A448YI95_BRENA|nr:DEKNAAC101495 [Brettanomyces naardenensis]
MNQIRKIEQLNEQELKEGISSGASWHQDYRDTSYIFIGNLPGKMNEMDILIVFSQYGVPTKVKLVRDKETGESMKFAFLKYEDFKSTILAVDNLNGSEIVPGTRMRVDHVRYRPYKYSGDDDANIEWDQAVEREMERDFSREKDEKTEAVEMITEKDEDLVDPMAGYVGEKEGKKSGSHHHHHHHHHHHRRKREGAE